MKIDELVGYKNKPEYQAVKDTGFIFGYGGLKDKLTNLGYNKYELGSGLYGSVYARPEDDFVVKIFTPDMGYKRYLDYMQNNKMNPYVPKLRGKPVKLPNNFTMVRIEKLEPITPDLFREIRHLMNPHSGDPTYGSPEYRAARKKFENRYPQFLNLLDELTRTAENAGLALDLHSGNIMMRNNLPVITDPFVG